jgi:hypothetical protein
MAIYFRSSVVVITDQLIKVRVPRGWRVWVISDLSDFGMVCPELPVAFRAWGLGWSALVVMVLASRLRGWLLGLAALLVALAGAWFVVSRRWAARRLTPQLWARRRGTAVFLFELPARDFDAACRALRRVLDRHDDERHRRRPARP